MMVLGCKHAGVAWVVLVYLVRRRSLAPMIVCQKCTWLAAVFADGAGVGALLTSLTSVSPLASVGFTELPLLA